MDREVEDVTVPQGEPAVTDPQVGVAQAAVLHLALLGGEVGAAQSGFTADEVAAATFAAATERKRPGPLVRVLFAECTTADAGYDAERLNDAFAGAIEDMGFGLAITLNVPGADALLLYEPQHPEAHSL